MEEIYYFRDSGLSFHKDPTNKDKYLVFTCAKNESEYIEEWVNHYLALGFDKIILVDNNELGDNSLVDALQEHISNGTVEIFDCRGMDKIQVSLYSDFCEIGDYRWCAYFDCDEFLEIGLYPDIKTFLSTQKCDCVLVNWLMFNANEKLHKDEGTVQERFPLPLSPVLYIKENNFIKSIVRGGTHLFDNNWFNGSHLPTMNNNEAVFSLGGYDRYNCWRHSVNPPHYKKLYLKHYYTKSFDEWVTKASRGWPDGTKSLSFSNFLYLNNSSPCPIEVLKSNLFSNDKLSDDFKKACDTFKMIVVHLNKIFSYALISFAMNIMDYAKSVTFVFINDEIIDDTMFNMFVEYAYITGNKVVCAFDENEVNLAINKFSPTEDPIYHIILGE